MNGVQMPFKHKCSFTGYTLMRVFYNLFLKYVVDMMVKQRHTFDKNSSMTVEEIHIPDFIGEEAKPHDVKHEGYNQQSGKSFAEALAAALNCHQVRTWRGGSWPAPSPCKQRPRLRSVHNPPASTKLNPTKATTPSKRQLVP